MSEWSASLRSMEGDSNWLTVVDAAARLGLSHSGLSKRVKRNEDQLLSSDQIRKGSSADEGGPERWFVRIDLIEQWGAKADAAGRAGATDAERGSELWLAQEQIDVLRADLAAERIENRAQMEEALRGASADRDRLLAERDGAIASLADAHESFARQLRNLSSS